MRLMQTGQLVTFLLILNMLRERKDRVLNNTKGRLYRV